MILKNSKPSYSIIIILCYFICAFSVHSSEDEYEKYLKNKQSELDSFSQSEEKNLKNTQKEVSAYKKDAALKFKMWHKTQKEEYVSFKNKIIKKWGKFIEPTNKRWVEYSNDYSSVFSVDFERGVVSVEVLISDELDENSINNSVGDAVKRVIRSKGASSHLPIETDKNLLEYPILKNQIINKDNQVVTESNVLKFIESVSNNIQVKKIENKNTAILEIKLVPDHLKKRMAPYLSLIDKYCKKYSLSRERVLATIEAESAFNPAAFSKTGAIGLMQLMPQYGGKEAYQFVYNTSENPANTFLFKPENNIELGCAYIYLLNNKYFSDIKNIKSLLFCSIAAYNTGPGNTIKAFTNSKVLKDAIEIINKNSSQWVFSSLKNNLPYKETRLYLTQVVKNMDNY